MNGRISLRLLMAMPSIARPTSPEMRIGSDEACRLIFMIETTSWRAAGISPIDV
jgi:hypothetical protein